MSRGDKEIERFWIVETRHAFKHSKRFFFNNCLIRLEWVCSRTQKSDLSSSSWRNLRIDCNRNSWMLTYWGPWYSCQENWVWVWRWISNGWRLDWKWLETVYSKRNSFKRYAQFLRFKLIFSSRRIYGVLRLVYFSRRHQKYSSTD